MKPIIYFILLTPILSIGCRGLKPVVVENYRTDSVYITETLRDTAIIVEPDSALLTALLECDSLGQVHIKQLMDYKAGGYIKPPQLSISNNQLKVISSTDSMEIYLQLKERHTLQSTASVVSKEIEVNRLSWWQTLWCSLGKIGAVVMVLSFVLWIVKK